MRAMALLIKPLFCLTLLLWVTTLSASEYNDGQSEIASTTYIKPTKGWLYPIADGVPVHHCVDRSYSTNDQLLDAIFLRDLYVDSGTEPEVKDGVLKLTMRKDETGSGVAAIMHNGAWYSHFMRVEAELRFQFVPGIVYAFVLRAAGTEEGRDEIDYEWVNRDHEVQTNVYANGHVVYGDEHSGGNGMDHHFERSINEWHKYSIDWSEDRIIWAIDDVPVRYYNASESYTRDFDDVKMEPFEDWVYPVQPMRLEFGMWDPNREALEGTMNWSGGPVNWDNHPDGITYELRNLNFKCYGQQTEQPEALKEAKEVAEKEAFSSGVSFPFSPQLSFALTVTIIITIFLF